MYNRSCVQRLKLQATNLESSIAARLREARGKRYKEIAKQVYAKCDHHLREMRNKKLKKLLLPDSRIKTIQYQQQKRRRRRFRRREIYSTRKSSDSESPTTVMNLSGVTLGETEVNLLLKGLSFCPTLGHRKKEEILDNLGKILQMAKAEGVLPGGGGRRRKGCR